MKGDGGYIVVAPSIHSSGNRYQWDGIGGAKALLSLADLPAWLLEYIAGARKGSRAESKAAHGSEKIPKGKRNDHLASLGGTMRKRGMSREAIEAALLEENRLLCDPPLLDAEVRRVAASVASYKPSGNDWAPQGALRIGRSRRRFKANCPPSWPSPMIFSGFVPSIGARRYRAYASPDGLSGGRDRALSGRRSEP